MGRSKRNEEKGGSFDTTVEINRNKNIVRRLHYYY